MPERHRNSRARHRERPTPRNIPSRRTTSGAPPQRDQSRCHVTTGMLQEIPISSAKSQPGCARMSATGLTSVRTFRRVPMRSSSCGARTDPLQARRQRSIRDASAITDAIHHGLRPTQRLTSCRHGWAGKTSGNTYTMTAECRRRLGNFRYGRQRTGTGRWGYRYGPS